MTSPSQAVRFPTTRPGAAPYLATAVAFALSFACAALDALGFLELGRIVTANRTLVSANTRPEYLAVLAGATLAVLTFAATMLVAMRHTNPRAERHRPPVPAPVGVLVVLQGAVLSAFIATAGPRVTGQLLVIALSAAALALQTVGALRITDPAGTGHVRIAHDTADGNRIGSVPTLVVGAMVGIAVVFAAPAAAAATSILSAIAAITLVRRANLLAVNG